MVLAQIQILIPLITNVYFPFRHDLIAAGQLTEKFLHLNMTNRFGVNYYIFDPMATTKHNPSVGIGLKTLGGKADFIEFRVGIGF